MVENPFDRREFEEYDEETFKDEVNNLIEWSNELDYDQYISNWGQIATSAVTKDIEDIDEGEFLRDN